MYQDDNNKEIEKNQMEILVDFNKKGKQIDWRNKKLNNILLSESYERLGLKKAYRVLECGTYLEFKKAKDSNLKKLIGANFCKDRLCPMCSWRRSLKIFGQVSKVMDKLNEENKYEFLFLTLTTKNVNGENLAEELNELFYGIKKFMLITKIKKSIKGWFRALEVTHNLDEKSEYYNTYHPHFHIILVVEKNYFKKKELYITQEEWQTFWQKAMKLNYIPIVDVRKVKPKVGQDIKSAVSETAKYTVKDKDYIIAGNEQLTDESVYTLNFGLKHRRLTAFGGKFKEIHKLLNLDDAETDDLINTDNDDSIRDDIETIIERYKWHIGIKQYVKF